MNKKILFTASRSSHFINFHMPYINHFLKDGFFVNTVSQGDLDINNVNHYNMQFDKNPLSPRNLYTALKIAKLIQINKYDIISCHTTLAGLITRFAVVLSGEKCRVIYTCHGYLFSDNSSIKSRLYLFFECIFSSVTDTLIVMNHEDYDIAKKYKLGKKIIFTYGMGLDKNKFSKINKFNKDTFNFLCVGELSKRKNQKMIILAFSDIIKNNLNASLTFAGDGKNFNYCKNLAHSLGIEKNINFLGHCDDVFSLYKNADCVVSASFSEGLPFNIMEALYCGIPVIASNIKGHSDLIVNSENGMLFSLSDQAELTMLMKKLIVDKNFYNDIKSNTNLNEKFLLKNCLKATYNIYNFAE